MLETNDNLKTGMICGQMLTCNFGMLCTTDWLSEPRKEYIHGNL